MEIRKGGQTIVGFPALVDAATGVALDVFDEPDEAVRQHRKGLRRLFALQLKETLRGLEKNWPDLQKSAVLYTALGPVEQLRGQVIDAALDRAFLAAPLPGDAASFEQRLHEGRPRLVLIANEVARLAAGILAEHATLLRKLRDAKGSASAAAADVLAQVERLMPPDFVAATPWSALQHLPRYLKAAALRMDKLRADPARDAARLAEIKPIEQRYLRHVGGKRGAADAGSTEFRWLLEELRVSLFAQELKTPQPVSVKRLEKAWARLCA